MSNTNTVSADKLVYRTSRLFGELSELELNAIAHFLKPRKIKKGVAVFEEGAYGDEMFVMISGKISAWMNQTDGTRRWIFELIPGDFFGEMSIIVNESRSATLIAETETELMALRGKDFHRIITEYPMIGVKILKVIGREQNTWLEQTSKYLNDLMRWGETARRRAVTDELTELYNRRFLDECARLRFEHIPSESRNVTLMMMDLDKIHDVNDRYGSKVGDLIIISAAKVLRAVARNGDICARLAGDEFAVLLPDTEYEEARFFAEKICKTIVSRKLVFSNNPGGTEQTDLNISTSIGIASAPVHANTWEDLFYAADKALSRAKELGRNRVEIAG